MGQPNMIRYDFEEIARCGNAMINSIAEVQQEVAALRGKLDGYLADWQGSGDDSYVVAKNDWDRAQDALSLISQQIAERVKQVNTSMQDTEGSVVKTFQSYSV